MCVVTEIELFEYGANCSLDLFVGLDEEWFTKEMWIQDMNSLLAIWMLLPAQIYVKITSDEQHAIFAQELQIALRLTVGFLTIFCEL